MSLVDTTTGEVVDRQVMPPLTNEERAALRDSIDRFGVLVPIVVDQHGNIIDGHNRHEIADELCVPCPSETVVVSDEEHAREVARSLNLDRRHLSPETRKAVALSLKRSGHSERAIAGALGVSKTQVHRDLGIAETQVEYQVVHCGPPDNAQASDFDDDEVVDPAEPERVTGTDGKQYPTKRRQWTNEDLARLLAAYEAGATQAALADLHDTTQSNIAHKLSDARDLRSADHYTADNPPRGDDKSRAAVTARRRLVGELAATGHTGEQIAKRLNIGRAGVMNIAKEYGIDLPGDRAVAGTRRHDPNRIVAETVTTLEGACMGLNLADPAELDPTQVAAWAESLRTSIKTLSRYLKEMTK